MSNLRFDWRRFVLFKQIEDGWNIQMLREENMDTYLCVHVWEVWIQNTKNLRGAKFKN